ncbi:MAG: transcription termination/antitermination factor NusG [Bacteroidetes bacterium]|nr:transcription termination/antitermination factor NusG [Bacteroidota bacterium]MBK8145450.1 transcription termination/antitermination factor NusG [Bacteroidota bacterium]MBP6315362.1 transcription termination/antitermination factor NusG [Chitinophagaceae bacterium]
MEDITTQESTNQEIVSPEKETKWFVLRVLSGKERKIKEYLDVEIRRSGWGNSVSQILCPIEKVFKVVAGKKVMREKILYPGYILLEATTGRLSDDILQAIKNVTGVIHFLGKERPDALRRSEVNKMFGKMDEMADSGVTMSEPFILGETVKIIDGPFNDFNGTVEEVNDDKKKLKVIVKIFGRATPVELNFMQVEKVS